MTAPAPALLPNPKDVRDLLEGLFGKDVSVAPGDPVSLNDKPAVAVYVDPTMAVTAPAAQAQLPANVPAGVTVAGVDLSGKSAADAAAAVVAASAGQGETSIRKIPDEENQ